MESQDNNLTKEEKLIYLLNKIEENNDDNIQKEELNCLRTKLLLKLDSDKNHQTNTN